MLFDLIEGGNEEVASLTGGAWIEITKTLLRFWIRMSHRSHYKDKIYRKRGLIILFFCLYFNTLIKYLKMINLA